MKQVLIETALFKPQQLSFTEGLKSKRGFPIVEGILATCEVKNGNGRYYSRELWEREMEKYKDLIDENMNIIAEEDLNKNSYNYEDKKNIDNMNGEEFKLGINFEMSKVAELLTSENMGEYLDKARKTVAKNLAANPLYYVENAAFGQEGIGYTEDAVGLKPTEVKGKYAESGYGDATKKEANDEFVEVKESKISFNDLLND